MSQGRKYEVQEFPGVEGNDRRSVLYLSSTDDRWVNIDKWMSKGRESEIDSIKTSMDYWVGGHENKRRHHPFEGKWSELYVFKQQGGQVRVYGFLHNPSQKNKRLRVCIVARKAMKKKHHTDKNILRRIEELRTSPEVQKAIEELFFEE